MTCHYVMANDTRYQTHPANAYRTTDLNGQVSCGKVAKAANLDRGLRHTVAEWQQYLLSLLKCPPFLQAIFNFVMSRLNPRQQEAVSYVGGPLLVLAGAGSGKTSVITRKIAHLIQNCGIRAQYIVAMTFTNKAAREMKERVGSLLKGGEGRGLTVCTFHNLGLNIIRKEHARLGYKPGFSIFDETDVKALMTDIMQKEYAGDDGVDEIKNMIGSWKNDLILPAEALENARNPKEQTAAIVYTHYQRTLKAFNAVDFDDLILLPVKLFEEHADILEKWQNKVRYLLVDEYQDTNASQ